MVWLYRFLGILLFLFIVLLLKTFINKKQLEHKDIQPIDIDEHMVINHFIQKIKYQTVSYPDPKHINQQAFIDFKKHLLDTYPLIKKQATYKEIGTGILFHIKGKSNQKPVLLMAHYDVVPVSDTWTVPPFEGVIKEDYIYGRGTLDTKITVNAIMEATEYQLSKNKTFDHDLYIAFSGEEEISGPTPQLMIDYLKSKNVKPYMVLDEGGAIVSNMFPGVEQKVAAIGIAEKGFMNVELSTKSKGGHASTPPKHTPLTRLSKAVIKLNNSKQFKMKMTTPIKALFQHVSPYSKNFFIRLLFTNSSVFTPLIKFIAKLSGGELYAMFKTTLAFTVSEGSKAYNVLPNEAKIGINIRLRPGETSKDVLSKIKKIIHDKHINVRLINQSEPTSTSILDDAYQLLEQAILDNWENTIVSPYLMVATTDSRHYHQICDRVYKFAPMDVSKEDLSRMHSDDERMSKENVIQSVKFYIRLLNQL